MDLNSSLFFETGWPCQQISPSSRGLKPQASLNKLVFPTPLSPSRCKYSPACNKKEAPENRRFSPREQQRLETLNMCLNDRRRCPFRIDSSQKIMSEKRANLTLPFILTLCLSWQALCLDLVQVLWPAYQLQPFGTNSAHWAIDPTFQSTHTQRAALSIHHWI